MAQLTELDVINKCLATQGEAPLNSIDPDHPFVAPAQTSLEDAMVAEQSKGWWFNEDWSELLPEPDGTVFFPKGAIKTLFAGNAYVQRGRRIWDRANSTFVIGKSVQVVLTMEIAFADLPMQMNNMIADKAVLLFQAQYDAESEKYQKLLAKYNQSYLIVKAEDIRQRRTNVFQGGTVSNTLARFRPMSRYTKNGI